MSDEQTPVEALEADATADEDKPVKILLKTENGEEPIYVPPVKKWRSRERHALLVQGDDYSWAEGTLSKKDFEAWSDLNPDMDELAAFLEAWGRATGEDAGKSPSSGRSSSSTRKR